MRNKYFYLCIFEDGSWFDSEYFDNIKDLNIKVEKLLLKKPNLYYKIVNKENEEKIFGFVTYKMALKFEEIRKSGKYNMIMDSDIVMKLLKIKKSENYKTFLDNYSFIMKDYNILENGA